jgi:CelD/BcsL family acetyltransferase involved in cellulose biosynthesis
MATRFLRFEVLQDEDAFSYLESEWDALCSLLDKYITVFASFIWFRNWWRFYGANARLQLFTMREGEKLIGLAPLMWEKYHLRGMSVRRIGFIQNNQSLHNDFIVLPEYRTAFLHELIQSLFEQSSKWDILFFRNFPLSSENYDPLVKSLEGRCWNQVANSINSPYLTPSGDWPKFFGGRSKKTRKALSNIKNRIYKAGKVSVKNIRTWKEFLSCKEELFDVAKRSWAEGQGDSLGSVVNREFFESLARSAAEKGWLSIWALYLDDKMIAMEFHLRGYGKEHALRGHYHPDFASLSPGTFLEMTILEQVFEDPDRVQVYDFCGSFENYKRKWTDTFVPHCDIHVFKNTIFSKFVRFHEFKIEPRIRMVSHYANLFLRSKSRNGGEL